MLLINPKLLGICLLTVVLAPNDFSADSRYEWSDTLSQGQPQRAAGKQAVRLKASGPILDGEFSKKRSVLVTFAGELAFQQTPLGSLGAAEAEGKTSVTKS